MIALEGILDEVMGAFGASSASICLQNADSDKLMIEVERAYPKSGQGFELPMGVGITGWVAMRANLLCADVENEEKYFRLDEEVKSEIVHP